RLLLVPGVKSVGLHSDSNVEVKPDLHAETVGKQLARLQLPIGRPLHEFDEFHLVSIGPRAQLRAVRRKGPPPFGGPFPPGLVKVMAKHFEAGEALDQRPSFGAKVLKILPTFRIRVDTKSVIGRAERAPFLLRNSGIIDEVALARSRECAAVGSWPIFRNF